MNTTTNLGLKKPQKAAGDPIDIDVLNDNSDIIDSFAGETNTALASKQKELTAAQQAAVDSGITAEKLAADEAALAGMVDSGAKSIFPIGVQSKDYSSTLSITVDNEGVITVNGTRNDSSGGILYQDLVTDKTSYRDTRYTLPVGTYGCKGGGTESIRLQVYCHDGTNADQLFNSSNDGTFTYSQNQKESKPYIAFRLAIQPGNVSLNNHKVYPMICTVSDWAVSKKIVPYCPSMQEMYQMILALQNGTRSAPALAKAEPEEIKEPETGEAGEEGKEER